MNTLNQFGFLRGNCARRLSGKLFLLVLASVAIGVSKVGAADKVAVGRFVLEQGEMVVFTGGANMVAAQENAYLETFLTLGFAERSPRFRNLAWEGDTVYEQRREMNFGSWQEQFKRVLGDSASVIFAQLGQMESLEGKAALPRFLQAYEKLLDHFSHQTTRIVLLSPPPFEKAPAPLPDLSPRNEDLRLYVEA